MIRRLGPVGLSIAGLVFLVAAAFALNDALGLAVAGLACFALEWRITE